MTTPTYVSRSYDTQVFRLRPLNNDNDVLRFMEDIRGFLVIDVYAEHIVEEINIKDIIYEEVNGEDANVEGAKEEVNNEGENEKENAEGANEEVNNEGENEEANVEDSKEESETDPGYNITSEDDKEGDKDDIDELNLGPNVGVGWKTIIPKATIE
ncbi:hypothetical protein KIW84_076024 [Lathyrus oleraceus]|uniref:Uncharacterized protein n=1 Tax=Pisum sativum TaxID=3888 RepID=A0A9D4VWK2_PEA|nr:hypothetical protein KIW84_076024 [Pisum sativum]